MAPSTLVMLTEFKQRKKGGVEFHLIPLPWPNNSGADGGIVAIGVGWGTPRKEGHTRQNIRHTLTAQHTQTSSLPPTTSRNVFWYTPEISHIHLSMHSLPIGNHPEPHPATVARGMSLCYHHHSLNARSLGCPCLRYSASLESDS